MSSPIALGRLPMPSIALATLCAVLTASVLVALGDGGVPSRSQTAPVEAAAPAPAPSFEANRGQAAAEVEFVNRGNGYTLFLTETEAVLSLDAGRPGTTTLLGDSTLTRGTGMEADRAVVRMGLAGAAASPEVSGRAQLPATASHIRGEGRHTGIPTFGRVEYSAVYPGIDMAWHGQGAGLEYDFEVAPGADASRIGLTFEGADRLRIGSGGDLVMSTAAGELRHQAPYAYQDVDGVRQRVESRYRIGADGTVGFVVGSYDHARTLVIDPQIVYSTYLGGSGSDRGTDVAVDGAGNAYIVGSTNSQDYPTTSGAVRETDPDGDSNTDVFVSKLSPDGSSLVYSTYLGSNGQDEGSSIAVDADGHAYVTGRAGGTTWPTTPGAFQPNDPHRTADLFVAKLSADGSALDYSSYLGGNGIFEDGGSIAVDADGSAYVAGQTDGSDFPTTPGSFQSSDPDPPTQPATGFDGFVTKFSPDGSALEWSTYLAARGGDGAGPIVVEGETPYVTGSSSSDEFPTTPGAYRTTAPSAGQESDLYVTRLKPDGSGLSWSTYAGGNRFDSASGIDVLDGRVYIAGFTGSDDYPTTAGSFQTSDPRPGQGPVQGFVTKLSADGSGLDYSTYLGGDARFEGALDVAVDDDGRASMTGRTDGGAFPTTRGAFQETDPDAANEDAFVSHLSPDGSELDYSTYLGGHQGAAEFGHGIEVAPDGDLIVGGLTHATDFPTTDGAYMADDPDAPDYEAFVAKIHPERAAAPKVPTQLALDPDTAVNTVGTRHCVTATASVEGGEPFEGATVRFAVSGSTSSEGSAVTGADGRATYCYDGPVFPGSDTIDAYADNDGDGVRGEGEPGDSATKDWVLGGGTAGCKVSGGGDVAAPSGGRATFGIGGGTFVDHGAGLRVKSIRELVVVCSEDRTSAAIYGEARVEGQGTQLYRVQVTDGGEPGRPDRYSILLNGGYSTGDQPLTAGNVQVR